MKQLKIWEGEFGKAYTDRNIIEWRTRLRGFQHMLDGLSIKRVLEVGCNRGHNLIALSEILGEDAEIVGVEPNQYAVELARKASMKVRVILGSLT